MSVTKYATYGGATCPQPKRVGMNNEQRWPKGTQPSLQALKKHPVVSSRVCKEQRF